MCCANLLARISQLRGYWLDDGFAHLVPSFLASPTNPSESDRHPLIPRFESISMPMPMVIFLLVAVS
jgi:hypothetical protein